MQNNNYIKFYLIVQKSMDKPKMYTFDTLVDLFYFSEYSPQMITNNVYLVQED